MTAANTKKMCKLRHTDFRELPLAKVGFLIQSKLLVIIAQVRNTKPVRHVLVFRKQIQQSLAHKCIVGNCSDHARYTLPDRSVPRTDHPRPTPVVSAFWHAQCRIQWHSDSIGNELPYNMETIHNWSKKYMAGRRSACKCIVAMSEIQNSWHSFSYAWL